MFHNIKCPGGVALISLITTVFTIFAPLTTFAQGASTDKTIAVTIRPIHSLTTQVLGGVQPVLILDREKDTPHAARLRPSQVSKLKNADLVIALDEEFELFLQNYRKTAPQGQIYLPLSRAQGITLLESKESEVYDDHHYEHGHGDHHYEHEHDDYHDEHEHDDHHDEHEHDDHHYEHGHDDHHYEHGHDDHHDEEDLHLWLDPHNGVAMLKAIAQSLSRVYPERAEEFARNADAAAKRLMALDQKIQKQLTPYKNAFFLIYHDAFGYFEARYGIKNAATFTGANNLVVTPKLLQKSGTLAKSRKQYCLIVDSHASERVLKRLRAANAGMQTVYINPLGAQLPAGAALYEALLTQISDKFTECLKLGL